ncbi:MAG: hypothetical protein N2C14_30955 [Planctomycetales bacterium]
MDQILYDYQLHLTTWVYLSSVLVIAFYFKFSPLFRLRNLDLLLLVGVAPALIMLSKPFTLQYGRAWLFAWSVLALARLLSDSLMVRRPRLAAN